MPDRLGAADQGGRRLGDVVEARHRLSEGLLDVDDDQGGPVAVELRGAHATPIAKLRCR